MVYCLGALAGFLLLGCGVPPDLGLVVRDSAGIRVVENSRASGPEWILDTIPAITFGASGSHPIEFISPVSAIRRADRSVVAAGWAMTELQVFDSLGAWQGTVGRRGGGPGEFEALGFVFAATGGGFVTFEPGTQRVQRWTAAGGVLDLALLVSPPGWPAASVDGVYPDGALLLSTRTPDAPTSNELISRSRTTLFRRAEAAARWDSLFSYLGGPSIRHPDNPGWSWGAPVLAAAPSRHLRDGRLVFTPGDLPELQIYEAGQLRMVVRWLVPERRVTGDELERAVSERVQAAPAASRERVALRIRETATARVRPPVSGVQLAGDGSIWAIFGAPVLGEPLRASVFDSLGRWEADVTIPSGVRVLQVDRDGLLGTDQDADGFHHLRFYRLRMGYPRPR